MRPLLAALARRARGRRAVRALHRGRRRHGAGGVSLTKPRLIGLAVAAAVFALDQGVKALLLGPLKLRAVGLIEVLPIFAFRWTENRGVSLGLLTADSNTMRWLLVLLTGAIAITVLVWLLREKRMVDIAALALVLGGALGNIRDRAFEGFVIDYADLHFGDFRPFLIFNVADAAITFGVLIILARSLLSRDKRAPNPREIARRQNAPSDTAPTASEN
ncbi:MAG: signal peptidase II [Novosphingobium sp.]|nr:signal peptidase II [Novosphingobium sp.]